MLRVQRTCHQHRNGTAVIGPPKSQAGLRTIAIPPHLLPALPAHLDHHDRPTADALLLTGTKGGPLRVHVLQATWDRARGSVGRPDLHLHDLRHSGNTWAAATGASTRDLMARMGHSSPRAALIYQHATAGRGRAIAEALSTLAPGSNAGPLQQGSGTGDTEDVPDPTR